MGFFAILSTEVYFVNRQPILHLTSWRCHGTWTGDDIDQPLKYTGA